MQNSKKRFYALWGKENSMPKQKKQHYVPQSLLKNFSNCNKQFYVFKLLKNSIINHTVPYSSQCYTNYFYGKDGKWENIIANYEATATPIVKKLIEGIDISNYEELIIKNFILFQDLRTEKAVDLNHHMLAEMYSKLIPIIAQQEGLDIPKSRALAYAHKIANETNRTDTAIKYMEFAEENKDSLRDLKLIVLNSPNYEFISSDHPVVIENKFDTQGGLGVLCAGIIYLMPISPHKCVMLYDDGIYDCAYKNSNNPLSIEEVKLINHYQYLHARELAYAYGLEALQDVKLYFDNLYIDKFLRDIYKSLGMIDPILINIAISNFKKAHPELPQLIIPKIYAKKEKDYIPFVSVKKEFVPYIANLNSGFSRFTDVNDIPIKYYCVGANYVNLIKSYLEKKKVN